MSAEDDLVYETESFAFEGTPLGDLQDRSSLILEAYEVATECPLLVGKLTVIEGSTRMTKTNAYAQPNLQQIVFAPTRMPRYVSVHEISHVVHHRAKTGGKDHGRQWRGVYVDMIAIVYGQYYGDLLREAFARAGIPADLAHLPMRDEPVIDIDALTLATLKSRWL